MDMILCEPGYTFYSDPDATLQNEPGEQTAGTLCETFVRRKVRNKGIPELSGSHATSADLALSLLSGAKGHWTPHDLL
jgi:hypothetical protein